MSSHVLLNLTNKLGRKVIKCEACLAFYAFFRMSLLNPIILSLEDIF